MKFVSLGNSRNSDYQLSSCKSSRENEIPIKLNTNKIEIISDSSNLRKIKCSARSQANWWSRGFHSFCSEPGLERVCIISDHTLKRITDWSDSSSDFCVLMFCFTGEVKERRGHVKKEWLRKYVLEKYISQPKHLAHFHTKQHCLQLVLMNPALVVR